MTQQSTTTQTQPQSGGLLDFLNQGVQGWFRHFSGGADKEEAERKRKTAEAMWQNYLNAPVDQRGDLFGQMIEWDKSSREASQEGADASARRGVRTATEMLPTYERKEEGDLARDIQRQNTTFENQLKLLGGPIQDHEMAMFGKQMDTAAGFNRAYLEGERMRLDTIRDLAQMNRRTGFDRITGLVGALAPVAALLVR